MAPSEIETSRKGDDIEVEETKQPHRKTNVGFIATSTSIQDDNFVPDDIPNSLALFSATYVPYQLVMVLLGHRVGPRISLSWGILSWGVLSMANAAINNSGAPSFSPPPPRRYRVRLHPNGLLLHEHHVP
ncbi:hypothetical protein MFIFM68171_07302 [Madurella fahalii]|uniref:Uncharacterized protein n=1 Tax=Madurella fahalii TaxID=1157608 RepID=A0ABQ0GH44_9PEZI